LRLPTKKSESIHDFLPRSFVRDRIPLNAYDVLLLAAFHDLRTGDGGLETESPVWVVAEGPANEGRGKFECVAFWVEAGLRGG